MRKTIIIGLLLSFVLLTGCVPKKVEVPNLIGIELESAIESLEAVNLNPDALKGDAAPEKDLEDIVYWQAPDPGERVRKGSIVTFTFYDEYIFVRPQRVISMLWMGDEKWANTMMNISLSAQRSIARNSAITWEEGFGGTHIVGFLERVKPDWYEGTKVKLIMYLKTDDLDKIRSEVQRWKNHPNLGGYWLISGHEPDITGGSASDPGTIEANKKLRREQYKLIRELDPDKWNHPVVIFYNMTSCVGWDYPGWEKAFPLPEEGKDCDVFVIDCYANNPDGTVDYSGMRAGSKLVEIGLARSKGQFIPNLGACYAEGEQPASLLDQFEWWENWYADVENQRLEGVILYNSGIGTKHIGVYEDEYLAEEARKINRSLGLLGD